MPISVTIWNEYVQDLTWPNVIATYPDGIHGALVEGLRDVLGDTVAIRTATLAQPQHGLPAEVLDDTDVLVWWAHLHHDDVDGTVVDRVVERVHAGMGLVMLHSGQGSLVFRRLMGTSCEMQHRDESARETMWAVLPDHPIAHGVPSPVVIPEQEMYGEFFDIPAPDELVFISSFDTGEVFRSGCCFFRGAGRIFYFGPGHEEYPVYYQPEVRQILANAVRWAAAAAPELSVVPANEPAQSAEMNAALEAAE